MEKAVEGSSLQAVPPKCWPDEEIDQSTLSMIELALSTVTDLDCYSFDVNSSIPPIKYFFKI